MFNFNEKKHHNFQQNCVYLEKKDIYSTTYLLQINKKKHFLVFF